MATGRIVLVALILVALMAVPVTSHLSLGKKGAARKIASASANAFRGAAKGKEARTISAIGGNIQAAGDSPVKDAASKYSKDVITEAASDIISNAASKAMIAVADKYMKEADVADSPENAAVDKKDAVQSVASALDYAFQGAQTTTHVVGPEAQAVSASPEKDDAAKFANAIISDAASKAHIEATDKYMQEAAVADSPEKPVVAKKAAAENIAAAMAYAVQGGAAVAPTAADTTTGDKSVKQEASVSTPLTAKDGAGYKA